MCFNWHGSGSWAKCSTPMCMRTEAFAWTYCKTAGLPLTTSLPSLPQSSHSWINPTQILQQTMLLHNSTRSDLLCWYPGPRNMYNSRRTDENTRREWLLLWKPAGWYFPRRLTRRRTAGRPRLESEWWKFNWYRRLKSENWTSYINVEVFRCYVVKYIVNLLIRLVFFGQKN